MAKGGVGKTTTAVNLAHGLSLQGKKVLVVDCDTQDQTSKFFGVSPPYGLYEFVTGMDEKGKKLLKKDILFKARENLWILSGGIKLVELKNRLGEQPHDIRHKVISKMLIPKNKALDFIIFDCSPGWDVLSVNILMAVDEVMCPVAVQGPCLEGLKTFFTYLVSVQKLNKFLHLKYILPTMYDRRTRQGNQILNQLRRLFRKQICEPIHHNVRLCEAPVKGMSIFEYDQRAISAKDYLKLSERLINDGIKEERNPRFF